MLREFQTLMDVIDDLYKLIKSDDFNVAKISCECSLLMVALFGNYVSDKEKFITKNMISCAKIYVSLSKSEIKGIVLALLHSVLYIQGIIIIQIILILKRQLLPVYIIYQGQLIHVIPKKTCNQHLIKRSIICQGNIELIKMIFVNIN